MSDDFRLLGMAAVVVIGVVIQRACDRMRQASHRVPASAGGKGDRPRWREDPKRQKM